MRNKEIITGSQSHFDFDMFIHSENELSILNTVRKVSKSKTGKSPPVPQMVVLA